MHESLSTSVEDASLGAIEERLLLWDEILAGNREGIRFCHLLLAVSLTSIRLDGSLGLAQGVEARISFKRRIYYEITPQ